MMPAPIRFDAIELGASYSSSGRTLTEAELAFFCMLTGDRHPIHADAESAKATGMGERIFHGTFGVAIAVAMATELPALAEPVIAATGLREWQFAAPIRIGDTVHAEVEVVAKEIKTGGRRGFLERRLSLVNQRGEVVQRGFSGLLVALRPD